MKSMRYIVGGLSMILLPFHCMSGSNFKTKLQAVIPMMTDYRSYRDPEAFKNAVQDYKQAEAYVEIQNLQHQLELQDLNLQLTQSKHDVLLYKTATQLMAPALAVTTGFHTFLNRRQQQSQSCTNAAIGISLGVSLFWMARSHFKVGDKQISRDRKILFKNR